MTAFAAAVAALFRDRNMARDGLWRQAGEGPPHPVRVVRREPDQGVSFGDGRFLRDSVTLEVRVCELAQPRAGDTVEIGADLFTVIGEPERDGQRLVWRCEASAGEEAG